MGVPCLAALALFLIAVAAPAFAVLSVMCLVQLPLYWLVRARMGKAEPIRLEQLAPQRFEC